MAPSKLTRELREVLARQGQLDGFFGRPTDAHVIWEARRNPYSSMNVGPSSFVLDVGGHIGTFARWAAQRGAQVLSVEPHPDTARLFRLNTAGLGVVLLEGAVGSDVVYHYGVHSNDSMFPGTGSGRGWKAVPCARFELANLLEAWQPTHVKMDIESGEYPLLLGDPELRPARVLAVEFHGVLGRRRDDFQEVLRRLAASGWSEPVKRGSCSSGCLDLLFTREERM